MFVFIISQPSSITRDIALDTAELYLSVLNVVIYTLGLHMNVPETFRGIF